MRPSKVIVNLAALSFVIGGALVGCDAAPPTGMEASPSPVAEPAQQAPQTGPVGAQAPQTGPAGAPQNVPAGAVNKPAKAKHFAPVAVPVSGGTPATVWMDPHEVTVASFKGCVDKGVCKKEQFVIQPDSTCNYDAPGRGDHPMNCVDYNGADAYCKYAGGRLCKEEEWFAGCRGPNGQDYPYGTTYQAGACNSIARSGPVGDRGTSPVGEYTSCEGGYAGLYDMVGNVSEWLDSCKGDYCHFYGGAFLDNDPVEDFSSCKRFCAGNQKTFRSSTIGFRCCYDAEPKMN